MRKIVEVLRLSAEGRYSHREIARIIHVSPTTVGEIIRRAKLAGVSYPLPMSVSEQTLEAQLMGWSPLLETASEVPKCGEWKFPPSKRGDQNEAYDDWY